MVVAFAEVLWGALPPEARLFSFSSGSFRSRWNAVVLAAGFSDAHVRDSVPPACLRGSCAAALYPNTSDVRFVQWRGRLSQLQALGAYIQVAVSAQSLQPLPPSAKNRVTELSGCCPVLLRRSMGSLAEAT